MNFNSEATWLVSEVKCSSVDDEQDRWNLIAFVAGRLEAAYWEGRNDESHQEEE